MRMPCEYVVRYLLPPLRAYIVKELVEVHGWSITRASRALRISVSAASKYRRILSKKFPIDLAVVERAASRLVREIVNGTMDDVGFTRIVCSLCMGLRMGGEICRIHRIDVPGFRGCDVCGELFRKAGERSAERVSVLMSLRRGLKVLMEIEDFSRLVPEVRTNLVMAVKDASTTEDVAGFPGRITVVKGRAFAPMDPEFGASKHMATILLKVMKYQPKLRAVICLKYSEDLVTGLEKLGLKVERVDRQLYSSVEMYLEKKGFSSDVLVDPGGLGIEPVIYIFGRDAVEVSRITRLVTARLGGG